MGELDTTALPPLDYAERPRWFRRRFMRRAMLGISVLLAILAAIGAGAKLWRDYELRRPVLAWQPQVLTFALPPDTIVFDEFREANEARLKTAGSVAKMLPNYLSLFATSDNVPDAVVYLPAPLRSWPKPAYPPALINVIGGGEVFLHARDAGRGNRLVMVGVNFSERRGFEGGGIATYRHGLLSAIVVSPCTWWRDMKDLSINWDALPVLDATPAGEMRLFAGQIDPSDASHFTFDYQTRAGRGTIDGWLTSGDQVKLQIRNGPATTHPAG